jgi:hypothetical protein
VSLLLQEAALLLRLARKQRVLPSKSQSVRLIVRLRALLLKFRLNDVSSQLAH